MTGFFYISELHAIRSTKPLFDTIKPGKGKTYDLSVSKKLSVNRFRTLAMLDLARSDLFEISKIELVILDEKPRLQTIDLCPPLTIPYGSLDIRESKPIISTKKYADLYKRNLPISLHTRRIARNSFRYVKKNKKPIFATVALLFLLTLPTLFYVKFLVESSYTKLLSLKSVNDIHTGI